MEACWGVQTKEEERWGTNIHWHCHKKSCKLVMGEPSLGTEDTLELLQQHAPEAASSQTRSGRGVWSGY